MLVKGFYCKLDNQRWSEQVDSSITTSSSLSTFSILAPIATQLWCFTSGTMCTHFSGGIFPVGFTHLSTSQHLLLDAPKQNRTRRTYSINLVLGIRDVGMHRIRTLFKPKLSKTHSLYLRILSYSYRCVTLQTHSKMDASRVTDTGHSVWKRASGLRNFRTSKLPQCIAEPLL
jgi:hypothetical protein